jgi:hypothetical protein
MYSNRLMLYGICTRIEILVAGVSNIRQLCCIDRLPICQLGQPGTRPDFAWPVKARSGCESCWRLPHDYGIPLPKRMVLIHEARIITLDRSSVIACQIMLSGDDADISSNRLMGLGPKDLRTHVVRLEQWCGSFLWFFNANHVVSE